MESGQIETRPLREYELDTVSGGRTCNHGSAQDGSEHTVRRPGAGDLGDLHLLRHLLVREMTHRPPALAASRVRFGR